MIYDAKLTQLHNNAAIPHCYVETLSNLISPIYRSSNFTSFQSFHLQFPTYIYQNSLPRVPSHVILPSVHDRVIVSSKYTRRINYNLPALSASFIVYHGIPYICSWNSRLRQVIPSSPIIAVLIQSISQSID